MGHISKGAYFEYDLHQQKIIEKIRLYDQNQNLYDNKSITCFLKDG